MNLILPIDYTSQRLEEVLKILGDFSNFEV